MGSLLRQEPNSESSRYVNEDIFQRWKSDDERLPFSFEFSYAVDEEVSCHEIPQPKKISDTLKKVLENASRHKDLSFGLEKNFLIGSMDPNLVALTTASAAVTI